MINFPATNYSIYWTKRLGRHLLAAVCGLMVTTVATATDFGVATWGMTPDEVRMLETRDNLTPFGETSYLIYQLDLPGIAVSRIIYQFSAGQLTEGRFIFRTTNPLDVAGSLQQYNQVKTLMSGQFGPPAADQSLSPQGDVMALTPESLVNELSSDRLILKSTWQTETATINHQLAWNVDQPHHQLHYLPRVPITPNSAEVSAF